jgi:hypothetical protein
VLAAARFIMPVLPSLNSFIPEHRTTGQMASYDNDRAPLLRKHGMHIAYGHKYNAIYN